MRSDDDLPSLSALRAFEAVAKYGSFRRAATQLLISQSVVSHHIHQLETLLGAALFERLPRGVALTPSGERYLAEVRLALSALRDATAFERAHARQPRLKVSLLPSFFANWLVTRLERFQQAEPWVDLQLEPTLQLADLSGGDADLAIRYGFGDWPGHTAQLLWAEALAPVLSPSLQASGPTISCPKDVLNQCLLQVVRPYEWDLWAETLDCDITGARTVGLSDYNVVIQAAFNGQGIAMGRMSLCQQALAEGRLVAPLAPIQLSPPVGHWLLHDERRPMSAAGRAFSTWLFNEVSRADQNFSGASFSQNRP